MRFHIDVDEQELAYFEACSRIRDIHPRSLLHRLLKTIAHDQMVGSILDDADQLRTREKGEHRYPSNTGRGNAFPARHVGPARGTSE